MTATEQCGIIRQILKGKLSVLYQQDLFLKLAAMKTFAVNSSLYDCVRLIELLSSIVDNSLLANNPRRALHYLCILDAQIERLISNVNSLYSVKLEKRLINDNQHL